MCNTEVDSSSIDQFLVLAFLGVSSCQLKMLLEAVYGLPYYSLLVVEETQLQEGVGLRWLVPLLVCYVEQVLQMLDGLVHIAVLRVGLC